MTNGKLWHILLAVAGISLGQVLIKLAAMHIREPGPGQGLLSLYWVNGYLIAGVATLGISTLLWTWILRSVQLNVAYPYMALCFIVVPLLCFVLLGEPISWKLMAGSLLIALGIAVIVL